MARSKARLCTERMPDWVLLEHMRTLVSHLRYEYGLNIYERDGVLNQLNECIGELQGRANQLQLPTQHH